MTEHLSTAPRRIEWAGPEGWRIWADEDGVHLRTPNGDALEQPDVLALIDLYGRVRDAIATKQIPVPTVPPRSQWTTDYAARAAARAVKKALDPTDNEQPF